MGLDVRALLLGAAAMTRRFLEEPFERNPVLQFAAVNYLMTRRGRQADPRPVGLVEEAGSARPVVRPAPGRKASASMAAAPTPLTIVQTRDLHSRGQQHQEGTRDKMINNLVVKTPRHAADHDRHGADRNEDDLNSLSTARACRT